MKALTLTQPWASLIMLGAKRIETRSWRTHYRGPLAIHASAGYPIRRGETLTLGKWTVERDQSGLLLRGPLAWPYRLPQSAILGTVLLDKILPFDQGADVAAMNGELELGDYSPGRFAWCLTMPERREVHDVKGALGLWNFPLSELTETVGSR